MFYNVLFFLRMSNVVFQSYLLPPAFPNMSHAYPQPPTSLAWCPLFINLFLLNKPFTSLWCLYTYRCGAIHWNMVELQGAILLKRTDSTFPQSPQLRVLVTPF